MTDDRVLTPGTVVSLPARRTPARRQSGAGLLDQPLLLSGLVACMLVAGMALFAWQLAPAGPKAAVGLPLQPPSTSHWFGTDDLGRDVFAGVVHGARATLLVASTTALISFVLGSAAGLYAGYFGGWLDDVLMRLAEGCQLLPRFFLALLLVAFFGGNIWLLSLILGLTFWPATARLLRAEVLSLRGREFVLAARALGARDRRVMVRHILPNAISPVVVLVFSQAAAAILAEAGLSFLGLGDPTLVSWGQMLNDAQRFLRGAWWLFLFPGAALALSVLATSLLADGLNDTLRPRKDTVANPPSGG